MQPERSLRETARGQWTVVRLDQLRAAGFTPQRIKTAVAEGHLHRRYRGIFTYGTDRPPTRGVLLAAQWSCGAEAYLTGRTALAVASVRGLYLGGIEVAVPRQIRRRDPPLRVQIARAAAAEVRHDGPLTYAGVPRALLDMADAAPVQELSRLITAAIHASRLRHREMRTLLERHPGHPGIAKLRSAYAAYLPRPSARSGLETRVAVELHGGPYHAAAPDQAKDEAKAAKLLAAGIRLFPVSDTRWELEPSAVLDDLEASLLRRGLAA